MKFHAPSFLCGVGLCAVTFAARERLRPVLVELGALAVHLARVGRGLAARGWENAEDLWAEVDERVRERVREAQQRAGRSAPMNGPSVPVNGVPRAA